MEISYILNKPFLSDKCLQSNNTKDFFKHLEEYEDNINKLKNNAKMYNKTIKHIATLENGKATVGLQELDNTSPFYHLTGNDNMLIITSNYYNTNKLIIRGPGSGALVTASGIVSYILNSVV